MKIIGNWHINNKKNEIKKSGFILKDEGIN